MSNTYKGGAVLEPRKLGAGPCGSFQRVLAPRQCSGAGRTFSVQMPHPFVRALALCEETSQFYKSMGKQHFSEKEKMPGSQLYGNFHLLLRIFIEL